MVDRLLASPHYGERWGRHWLDLARYADSDGYSIDAPRPIWKYRDWVINALNRDMPRAQETVAGHGSRLRSYRTGHAGILTRHVNGRYRQTMNGDLGYLGRNGLAAWGFELPFPAVDIGLDAASLADSEEYMAHSAPSRSPRTGATG